VHNLSKRGEAGALSACRSSVFTEERCRRDGTSSFNVDKVRNTLTFSSFVFRVCLSVYPLFIYFSAVLLRGRIRAQEAEACDTWASAFNRNEKRWGEEEEEEEEDEGWAGLFWVWVTAIFSPALAHSVSFFSFSCSLRLRTLKLSTSGAAIIGTGEMKGHNC